MRGMRYALPLAALLCLTILGNFAFAPASNDAIQPFIEEILDRTYNYDGSLNASTLFGRARVNHINNVDILLNLDFNITGMYTNYTENTNLNVTDTTNISLARKAAAFPSTQNNAFYDGTGASLRTRNTTYLLMNLTTSDYLYTNYSITESTRIPKLNLTSSIVSGSSQYSDQTTAGGAHIIVGSGESTLNTNVTLRLRVNITNDFYGSVGSTTSPITLFIQFAQNSTNEGIFNITSFNSTFDCNGTGTQGDVIFEDAVIPGQCSGMTNGYYNCFNVSFETTGGLGLLGPGNSTWCEFNVSFASGVNFDGNFKNVTILEGYTPETYIGGGPHAAFLSWLGGANTNPFTGLSSQSAILRGPVKQGVDLKYDSTSSAWSVRGFIQNMANASAPKLLQYNVSKWELYQVLPNGTVNMTNNITGFSGANITAADGPVYTSWQTLSSSKEFWASSFDWSILGTEVPFSTDTDTAAIFSRLNLFDIRVLNIDNNTMHYSGTLPASTWNNTLTVRPIMTLTSSNAGIDVEGEFSITLIGPNETSSAGTAAGTYLNYSTSYATSDYTDTTKVHWWNGTDWNEVCTARYNSTHTPNITITQDANPLRPSSTIYEANKTIVKFLSSTWAGTGPGAIRWKNSTCNCYNGTSGNDTGGLCPVISDGAASTALDGLRPEVSVTGTTSTEGYDMIRLTTEFLSPSLSTSGETISFTGNATAGTSMSVTVAESLTAQSYTVMESEKALRGWKDIRIEDPNNPTIVSVSIQLNVSCETGKNISGIYFADYVPQFATNFSTSNPPVSGWFYNGSTTPEAGIGWNNLSAGNGGGFNVTHTVNSTLPDGGVGMAFIYNHSGAGTAAATPGGLGDSEAGTFTLQNNDVLLFNYTMNLTSDAVAVLPTLIFGLDPDTGEAFKVDLYKRIRVAQPAKSTPIIITEGRLELAKFVTLGTPAYWIKSFEVHNPNANSMQISLSTDIFADAMRAEAVYTDSTGKDVKEEVNVGGGKATWETMLSAGETRSYMIKVFTPPVTEVSRSITNLEQLDDDNVRVTMEIFVKNLAEEPYDNVRVYLPIDISKIESVQDDTGKDVEYISGGAGTTIVRIKTMNANELKQLVIKYRQGYPVVVITPDQSEFAPDTIVGLSILVINGGQRTDRPYLETEVYAPDMGLIYSSVQQTEGLDPAERVELTEKFHMPLTAPTGRYIVNTRFREDFSVISEGSGYFTVAGGAGTSHIRTLMYLALILFSAVMLYVSGQRFSALKERSRKRK